MTVKGWVDRSRIDARLGYKILIAGLAEAGKTAVKRQFFLKHKTEEVDGLSATLSYERLSVTIDKTPITILDLGGQKIFLKRFLTTFSPFIFSSVVALIFLIDVSHRTSRDNAVQYFKACIEKLQTYSKEAQIYVFLHKNDLVENWPNYETIHDLLKEEFQIECNKQVKFFRTTIFNPQSIVESFGRVIELSMPELSQSEFVEGQVIGEIEEYSSKEKVVISSSSQTKSDEEISEQLEFDEDEDPAYLERIQSLMKGSMVDESIKPKTSHSAVGEAITEEMLNESELIPPALNQTDEISTEKTQDIAVNREISSLIDYYGIDIEIASAVVNSGFKSLFQMATTAGVPLHLVSDVITKYIPFLKSQGLDLNLLTLERLLDIFSSYLRKDFDENGLFSCLIFAVKKPDLTIDQITKNYLVKPQRKPKGVGERVKTSSTPQVQQEISVESVKGIIPIPNSQGLGFKANLTKHLLYLTIYCENRIVNRIKLSPTISIKELVYLLTFQMNLDSLGFIYGGERSINLSALIIHDALSQMREAGLTSTCDIKGVNIPKIMKSYSESE